jgi:hypothetical protein
MTINVYYLRKQGSVCVGVFGNENNAMGAESSVVVECENVCWSEGRNATLRSKSPPLSCCSDRDKAGRDTLRLIGTRRRPATKVSL